MPCYDPRTVEEEWEEREKEDRRIAKLEAMLCAIMRALVKRSGGDNVRAYDWLASSIDWKESGLKLQDYGDWFAKHEEKDKARKALEAKQKAKEAARKAALAKLTPQDRKALGLK